MAPEEKAIFIAVAQRWDGFNNGQIGLGVRDTAAEVHIAPNTATRAFNVLQERGFLELMRDSSFHQKKLVREWRVTCFPVGPWNAPTSRATHDYQRWRHPEIQKPVANGVTHSLKPFAPVSNGVTDARPIVSNGVTVKRKPVSNGVTHLYTREEGEPMRSREAEPPGDAQRSAADAPSLPTAHRFKETSHDRR